MYCVYSPFGQWVQAVLEAFWQLSTLPGWLGAGHKAEKLSKFWPRGIAILNKMFRLCFFFSAMCLF